MQMYESGVIKDVFMKSGNFLNFALGDGLPPITDYFYLDREIVLGNDNTLEFQNEKQKTKIDSIAALKSIFEELVFDVVDCFCKCAISHWNIPIPCDTEEAHSLVKKYFNIDPEYHKLLANQLIADILYDKYFNETYMTLNKYCEEHFYVNHQGEWKKPNEFELNKHGNAIYTKGTVYKTMDRKIKAFSKMMSSPYKKEELLSRGMDPVFHAEYIEKKGERKPKWIFDLIYYNEKLAAYKQNRRDAWDGSDEAYKQYAQDLIDYDKFVEKAFRPTAGCDKDYFHKSMSRYFLESHSSLEFIYKLAERLEKENVTDERTIHYLTEQHSVHVSCPVIGELDGSEHIYFFTKLNDYASTPFIEATWLAKSDYMLDEVENNPFYSLIGKIRIQTRELFKYHYAFESDNYEDISGFIKNEFNILDKLHDKQKLWRGWAVDSPLSDEQKERIDRMRMATSVIFTKFDAKKASAYIRTPEGDTEENYQNLFHTNREEFNRILSALENAHAKLHTDGGRPPSMSHIEKFAVTMEYLKYNRTMDEMAAYYSISKRQMSETVYQVVRAIYDDELTT
jgi:hypothetical protein